MTVITFDDNLITGNKTIDEQHKELIDRIQQFVSACESEDARVKAIKMLDYLDEYTEFHFKEEEKLQKDVGYLFHKLFIWSLIFIQIIIEFLNSMPELLMLLYIHE